MAKTRKKSRKTRGRGRRSVRTTGLAKKPEEVRRIRHQVTNVILDGSLDMTRRVVREVNEEGSVSALKFLWDTARLFPAGETEEESDGEGLAKALLKALGFPTDPPNEDEEEKDESKREADVESEESDEGEEIGTTGDGEIG